MSEDLSRQIRNERSSDRFAKPRIWSCLWRGAVGGLLGLVVLIIYVYSNSSYLNGIPVAAFLAATNGMLVGTVIWAISRWSGRDLGVLLRIIVGTVFSFCSSTLYLYLLRSYGDLKSFVIDALLLGLTFGGFAAAFAGGARRKNLSREDQHKFAAATDPTPRWSYLVRGAVGGFLGVVALFFYRLYTNPYLLSGLLPKGLLIAILNGLLIGGLIFYLDRLMGKSVGLLSRMLVGILFSFCSIAVYSFLDGAFYGDVRAFITNSLIVGVLFGLPAGAIAKGNTNIYELS